MYRLLGLFLLLMIVALQLKLWRADSEGSWTAEQALKEQVEEQRSENERLKQRNAALVAEVEDLKNGQTAVEERARSELGMVKPGETFYRVVEPADPKANVRPEDVPEDAGSPASPATSAQSAGSPASAASAAQSPGKQASSGQVKPASDKQAPGASSPSGTASPNARASKK